ncbi:hypothetical protein GDO81_028498 [Engystomops pustulosus]|uniref:Uncharacterized protein n=1 Tax=Engystomops pustulosus TaxID=76066 RepID=A0AAV6YXM9_ENGPU|nr:hypothetical protein GDO81_028498 [Engystomops pustulosus]
MEVGATTSKGASQREKPVGLSGQGSLFPGPLGSRSRGGIMPMEVGATTSKGASQREKPLGLSGQGSLFPGHIWQ